MVQKIGIIAQDGTNSAFAEGAYRVVCNLLTTCNAMHKYQPFYIKDATPFIGPIIQKGINQAGMRYRQRGYRQINAEPIMEDLLNYSAAYPDTEFVLVMRDSIYAQDLNYFLGVNRKAMSTTGQLLNTTIVSTGKNSPFELDGFTFQSVLMHELGHRFGATDQQNRKMGELYNYPQMGTHCTTPGCIMNVMNSLDEGKMAAHRRATYCPGCVAAMKREFSR